MERKHKLRSILAFMLTFAMILGLEGTALTSQLSPIGSIDCGRPLYGHKRSPPHTTVCRFGSNKSGYIFINKFLV